MTQLVLASTSPRRIELMKQVGFAAAVCAPDADETRKRGESPRALVVRLALEKAISVTRLPTWQYNSAIIVGADTIVVAPDGRTVLGKPVDTDEAMWMLKKLAGKTHTVFTGYAIVRMAEGKITRRLSKAVSSKVTMRKLDSDAIRKYVATGEPMDKAGAYGAQGIGMGLIDKLNGSYTNVVGLPMSQLLVDLEKTFGISPGHPHAG